MKCRFCHHELTHEFVDLVNSPPSNSFLTEEELNEPEAFYPLKLYVCGNCFLVQIDEYRKSEEIFCENYVYYSSFSKSWLEHARNYVEMITSRMELNSESFVMEVASNDGYLLQYFKKKGIPCLGIEPAKSTAQVARQKGIETITEFFGSKLAAQLVKQGTQSDLLIGNNVLAHVPNINDFVEGVKIALKPEGAATMEFPHLLHLVEETQFDTIYHEHFSYLSFHTVRRIFAEYGLELFDVEELPTHGGSLRIYAKHQEDERKDTSPRVQELLEKEKSIGMDRLAYYQNFQAKVDRVKYELLSLLIEQKRRGKKVVAYGAAAKGNTLLNYCGIKTDLIPFVVDASPHKQGRFLPCSHIPVVHEENIKKTQPDFVLILPWNIKDEIMDQLAYIRKWGGRFVLPIPKLAIC
jgi:2-polyprenyl-3-methyl-5-hydroxy-6-metoxy-1,4-benzoquinol methylase